MAGMPSLRWMLTRWDGGAVFRVVLNGGDEPLSAPPRPGADCPLHCHHGTGAVEPFKGAVTGTGL